MLAPVSHSGTGESCWHRWVMLAPVSHAAEPVSHAGTGESCWHRWVMLAPVSHACAGESCLHRWVMPAPVSHVGTGESCWHRWVMLAPVSHAGTDESCWHRWVMVAPVNRTCKYSISLITKRINLSGMFNEILEFFTKLAIWKICTETTKMRSISFRNCTHSIPQAQEKNALWKNSPCFFSFTGDNFSGVTVQQRHRRGYHKCIYFNFTFIFLQGVSCSWSFFPRAWYMASIPLWRWAGGSQTLR